MISLLLKQRVYMQIYICIYSKCYRQSEWGKNRRRRRRKRRRRRRRRYKRKKKKEKRKNERTTDLPSDGCHSFVYKPSLLNGGQDKYLTEEPIQPLLQPLPSLCWICILIQVGEKKKDKKKKQSFVNLGEKWEWKKGLREED